MQMVYPDYSALSILCEAHWKMKTSKIGKPLIVLTPYFLAALILFLSRLTLATPSPVAVDAAPAPTATPLTIEAVPQDGHCTLLIDGDTCYIVTFPGCNWTMTKYGEDSMGVTLECDPVRDEGVGVELKDGGE